MQLRPSHRVLADATLTGDLALPANTTTTVFTAPWLLSELPRGENFAWVECWSMCLVENTSATDGTCSGLITPRNSSLGNTTQAGIQNAACTIKAGEYQTLVLLAFVPVLPDEPAAGTPLYCYVQLAPTVAMTAKTYTPLRNDRATQVIVYAHAF